MQTFLPYSDFKKSAKSLDYRRLGKQRLEAKQILNVLQKRQPTKGWHNHPAVLMWRGYENALALYYNTIVSEWIDRGYKNNMQLIDVEGEPKMPWWFGNEKFHRSQRSRLIVKKEDFYLPLFPKDKNYNEGLYLWPVNETKTFKIIKKK